MLIVLYVFFVIATLILICYNLCLFYRFVRYEEPKQAVYKPPVSVLICAKDEAENLKSFLPDVYNQDYPNFEVVLINDRSIDDTLEVMQMYRDQHPEQTVLVNVPHSNDNRLTGNKKYALTLGIKAARYNHLLFTDADCKPVSNSWIQIMAEKFNNNKQIVLGYGKYQIITGWLNKLIRFETLQTAVQYFSYALAGMPYMGVGRNLAYTKDLFMQNNGFYNHLDVLSGDDDLFVNETATVQNTAVAINSQCFTLSVPKTSWKKYFYQKRRHISSANYYQTKHKFWLGLYSLSLFIFWGAGLLLLFLSNYKMWVLVLMSVRLSVSWFILHRSAQKLKENHLIFWFPLLEISLLCLHLLIFVFNLYKKPLRWTS